MNSTYTLSPTSPNITRLGKYSSHDNKSASFYFTGSGIEFITSATELSIEIESLVLPASSQELWVTVEIDGALIQRRILEPGINRFCLFRKLSPASRVIRILRETQFDYDATIHEMRINSLYIDSSVAYNLPSLIDTELSALISPTKHSLSIEFIGDSLTSGEGLNGSASEMSYVSSFYGFKNNYAQLVADRMDSYFSICSQSGWGIYCSYDGNKNHALPTIYFDKYINNAELIDDHSNKDIIFINLGTNDLVSQCLSEDKSVSKKFEEEMTSASKDFIAGIRQSNPDSMIVWIYGMLLNEHTNLIECISYSTDAIFCELPALIDYGSREHPGTNSHKATGEAIISKLRLSEFLENKRNM